MNDPEISHQVATEVAALHVEFERWLRGESEDLGRVEASLSDDFTFVSPQGDVIGRREVLENLREGHGARRIRIRIESPVVRLRDDAVVVATYEEWHEHADHTTARRSTVVFTAQETAPGGLRWRHVHETWMIPPPDRR